VAGAPFRIAQLTGEPPRNAGRREACMPRAPFAAIARTCGGIGTPKENERRKSGAAARITASSEGASRDSTTFTGTLRDRARSATDSHQRSSAGGSGRV
jgi:hypothetical protein